VPLILLARGFLVLKIVKLCYRETFSFKVNDCCHSNLRFRDNTIPGEFTCLQLCRVLLEERLLIFVIAHVATESLVHSSE